jgi:hypothetical protein
VTAPRAGHRGDTSAGQKLARGLGVQEGLVDRWLYFFSGQASQVAEDDRRRELSGKDELYMCRAGAIGLKQEQRDGGDQRATQGTNGLHHRILHPRPIHCDARDILVATVCKDRRKPAKEKATGAA